MTFQLGDKDTPSPADLRAMHARGDLHVLGEVGNQYAGILPDDPRMEPYWALAEDLDMPVGSHVGPGPPGAIYIRATGYRARMHSALTLEAAAFYRYLQAIVDAVHQPARRPWSGRADISVLHASWTARCS